MQYIKKLVNYVSGVSKYSYLQAGVIFLEKLVRLILFPLKYLNNGQNIQFYIFRFNYVLQSMAGKFYIRAKTDDEFIVSPMFESELEKYFKMSGGIFLDIGSHIGKYSVLVGKQNPVNRIIAFEANTQTYKSVKINLILNNLTNSTVENIAVGDKKGELTFLESSKNTGVSRIVSDDGESLIKEGAVKRKDILLKKIPIISIDEYIVSHNIDMDDIRLIKIDTEGNEYSVLKGMKHLLEVNKSLQLVVEITENLEEILEYMSGNGYNSKKISETYFVFASQ